MSNLVELGDVADVNWGDTSTTKSAYVDEGFSAYSAAGPDGFLAYSDYDREAVVLSAIGARCGKTWFATGKWSCIKNTIRFWSKTPKLDNKYLYWVTNREDFFPKRGAAQPFITIGDARKARIFLPPLDEQKRIAAILDKADQLRQKRRQAMALFDSISSSLIEEVVKDTSGRSVSLGDSLSFITSGGRNWSRYYAESGSRFIRSLDVQMNYIGEEELVFVQAPDNAEARRARAETGDVLLTITGSRIGRVAALTASHAGSYVSQHVAILRPIAGKLNPEFLSYFLSSAAGQRQIAKWQYGQTKPGLNFEQLRSFEIPDVDKDTQNRFVSKVRAIASRSADIYNQNVIMETLFASLQHRAFNSQI